MERSLQQTASARESDGPQRSPVTKADLERTLGYLFHRLGSWRHAESALEFVFIELVAVDRTGLETDAARLFEIAHRTYVTLTRAARVPSVSVPAGSEFARVAAIADAFELLTPLERRALVLREWSGLSYREVATELGLDLASTERLFFAARRRLPAAASSPATVSAVPLVA